jgi:XTP/dITP diphosphohydrolase
MISLVLASGNPGKAREFRAALGDSVQLSLITDYVPDFSVVEDGDTFHENARIKAEAACNFTGLPALADDSGLCVYYLGGEPGVRSARYAGETAGDDDNNLLLQQRMQNARSKRGAHFVSAVCLKVPGQPPRFATGMVFGTILAGPKGHNGFGYDPLFQVFGQERTLAEMSVTEKNLISHRGLALRQMASIIGEVLGGGR